MKILINRGHLVEGLKKVIGIVENRQVEQILENVLFRISQDRLYLVTTDSEIESHTGIMLQESYEEFETTIPIKKLFQLVQSMSSELVAMILEDDKVTIASESGKFSIYTLPASDFALLDLSKADLSVEISKKQLKNLLLNTHFAIALKHAQSYAKGLLFEFSTNRLQVVATDGHRISTSIADVNLPDTLTKQVILPRKAVLELMKIVEDAIDMMKIHILKNAMVFEFDNTKFVSRLVDASFPKYRALFEQIENFDIDFVVDTKLFMSSLKRISIFSTDKFHRASFVLSKSNLRISSGYESDTAEENITIDYEKDELQLNYNVDSLLDILACISSANTSIKVESKENGVSSLCLTNNNEGVLSEHLVMPLV